MLGRRVVKGYFNLLCSILICPLRILNELRKKLFFVKELAQTHMVKEITELVKFCEIYGEKLALELNGHQIPHQLNPMLITALWLRIGENFDGIVKVVKEGRPINGFILIRSMTETYILMKKCINDKNFYKRYFNKFANEKIKRLGRVAKISTGNRFSISKEEAEDLQTQFKSQIHDDASPTYNAKELFVEPDDINLYEMVYSHCNLYTHCDASSLDVYIETKSDGSYKLVNNNRIIQDAALACFMAASLYLKCFELYSKFVGHQSVHGRAFVDEYNRIHDLIKQKMYEQRD